MRRLTGIGILLALLIPKNSVAQIVIGHPAGSITENITNNAGSPDTSIQFNNGGNFAGSSKFVFNSTSGELLLNGLLSFQVASTTNPDSAAFLYNGSSDASIVDMVMHTSGDDWQQIRAFISGGTLAAPDNTWSSDALSINYNGWVNGAWRQLDSIDIRGLGSPSTNAAFGNIVFTMNSGTNLSTTKTITFDQLGVITPQGYKSSDGTAGATTTCTILGLTSITVKNGLITACS